MSNTKKCEVCGYVYELEEEFEYDTWNLGHYGCDSLEKCPKYHKRWIDRGCPKCYERELEEKKRKKLLNGWISVKDRLPDNGKEVLILNNDKDIYLGMYVDEAKSFFFDFGMEYHKIEVTHWRPLPEPPKGD